MRRMSSVQCSRGTYSSPSASCFGMAVDCFLVVPRNIARCRLLRAKAILYEQLTLSERQRILHYAYSC